MHFKNFTLDRFQEKSIESINNDHSVMVSAPTGSGKTLIADYIIDKELKGSRRVIYTAPIKALSNQKFKDFVDEYGEDRIGLVTGDIVINPEAQVVIMTTEVYRNMAIIKDPALENVAYCIMDEIHFINDEERGIVWEESIIFSPDNIRFLFLSATVPNASEFAAWVKKIKHQEVDVIESNHRPVPLKIRFYDKVMGISTIKELKSTRGIPSIDSSYKRSKPQPPDYREVIKEIPLPCIYFVFSRARTQQYATKLKNSYLNNNEKAQVAQIVQAEFKKISKEVAMLRSSQDLRQCISRGIAFHHAGLLPDLKHVVEKLFANGLIKVLFATETFAVGINMPAKTVCFDSLRKYTGTGFRYLNTKEFFQISGRAGRRGMDKEGLAVSVIHRPDFGKLEKMTKADTMPITSQFRMSYNTVLNMINQHSPEEISTLLKMNFFTFQQANAQYRVRARYEKALKTLRKLGYIKDNSLTEIGKFTTKIYSDELDISQIFMNLKTKLDEFEVLLLVAALAYEKKREYKFAKNRSKEVSKLIYSIRSHKYLKRKAFVNNIEPMTAVVQPIYQQKTFIDILKNTGMVEGDLMRLLMQMLDRLEQIDRALMDHNKQMIVRNCKHLIRDALEGIGIY